MLWWERLSCLLLLLFLFADVCVLVESRIEHAVDNEWLWQTTQMGLDDASVKTALDEDGNVFTCGRERAPLDRREDSSVYGGYDLYIRRYNTTTGDTTHEIVITAPVSSDGLTGTPDGEDGEQGKPFVSDCVSIMARHGHLFVLGWFNGSLLNTDNWDALPMENNLDDGRAINGFLSIYRWEKQHNRFKNIKAQVFGSSGRWEEKVRKRREDPDDDINKPQPTGPAPIPRPTTESEELVPRGMSMEGIRIQIAGDFRGNIYFFDGTAYYSESLRTTFVCFILPASSIAHSSWENLRTDTYYANPVQERFLLDRAVGTVSLRHTQRVLVTAGWVHPFQITPPRPAETDPTSPDNSVAGTNNSGSSSSSSSSSSSEAFDQHTQVMYMAKWQPDLQEPNRWIFMTFGREPHLRRALSLAVNEITDIVFVACYTLESNVPVRCVCCGLCVVCGVFCFVLVLFG
eukprot:TRINITY_DN4480_c0_g1_i1.p1 TRINITY_DN4480_c0_g1~~TRINITY_DN4480_c0_g1_i1.p1  ORF type:complete len:459 (+),score=72.30 TRINITY_DN4480_c0_g1_i1:726-2102(+)